MADFDGVITPGPGWPTVPQLSTEAVALGGAEGAMNAQAQALAARAEYLRLLLELLTSGGGGGMSMTHAAPPDVPVDPGGSGGTGGGVMSMRVFTSSTTFTVPAGKTMLRISAHGGGAGGYLNPGIALAGGGAGAHTISEVAVTPGAECVVTVGAGGAGTTGGLGGDTTVTIAGTVVCKAEGGGGTVGGDTCMTGGDLESALPAAAHFVSLGGGYGTYAPIDAAPPSGVPASGGASPRGGAGGVYWPLAGRNGQFPGGGGLGAGIGAPGLVVIEF